MALNTQTVGSNQVLGVVLQDPSNASSIGNLGTFNQGDGNNLSALISLLAANVNLLKNASGNFDRQIATPGATGVPVISSESIKTTYSAANIGFTPVATPTDFWQLLGSASKTIRLLRLAITGIATSASTVDLQLIKRSTADTGGTPSSVTIVPHDSNDAAASAAVNTFAANPSPLGTSLGNVRAAKLNLAAAAGPQVQLVWDFTNRNDKAPVLRGVAQGLYLNWNGAAVPSGTSLDIEVTWTEE